MPFRTDRNNNPTAFTTDIAIEGSLKPGIDFVQGDPFNAIGKTFYTAKLIGDPIAQTINVIDRIGFRVGSDPFRARWSYINIPLDLWMSLTRAQKIQVIGDMYKCEGGIDLAHLFGTLQK